MSTILVALPIATSVASDPDPLEYVTVDGVLTSDYYDLYPYERKSLSVGFSKYGEMESLDVPAGKGSGVALQYPGYNNIGTYDQLDMTSRDPFANEGIDMRYWLNGWFIEIEYTHRTLRDRFVWAFAMFADMTGWGGPWRNGVATPSSPPPGGRKTSAYAESEELTVLYDGPRRFVGMAVTHIYDWEDYDADEVIDTGETWPVVDVTITMIFNKVKKAVILLKDIKLTLDWKVCDSPVDIQFSNRNEWDIGPIGDYTGYAHFWHQEKPTTYGEEWHMTPFIMRDYWQTFTLAGGETPDTQKEFQLEDDMGDEPGVGPDYRFPVVDGSVRVYVNDVFQEEGSGRDYTVDYESGLITFAEDVVGPATVKVKYKLHKWCICECGIPHYYDLAQIISSDEAYVGFAAFWPTLSDYTVDGWGMALETLINIDDEDMIPYCDEPDIPFVIGEWDFQLDPFEPTIWPIQFRGVTVYGLTDLHDGQDEHMLTPVPAQFSDDYYDALVVDREVQFLLDEIFDPFDIKSSVHKDTKRWVHYFEVVDEPLGENEFILPAVKDVEEGVSVETLPVVRTDSGWDAYCSFGERVLVKLPTWPAFVLITPWDAGAYVSTAGNNWLSEPYTYKITAATGLIEFFEDLDGDEAIADPGEEWMLPEDTLVKVLWSSRHEHTKAAQWTSTGVEQHFPLHDDVLEDETGKLAEVFDINGVPEILDEGDYVLKEDTLFLQDAVPSCQWLVVEYEHDTTKYLDTFHQCVEDPFANEFTLTKTPKAGTYMVYVGGKEIFEETDFTVEDTTGKEGTEDTGKDEIIIDSDAWPTGLPACTVVIKYYTDPTNIAGTTTWYITKVTAGTDWIDLIEPNAPNDDVYVLLALATLGDPLAENDYVIRETPTCDELVLKEPIPDGNELKIVFKVPGGRYEWTVVGRDARTVDSLGAALITAAIKNKYMEIGNAGMDMLATDYPTVPFVMYPFGTTGLNDKPDYRDTIGRGALWNSWCLTWPVKSSNMIGIGGALANEFTRYFNEFTQAFGAYPPYADASIENKIFASTCWGKNAYQDVYEAGKVATGYATIGVYKDLDGTIGLVVWGETGQDTYWACRWFEFNKFWLQHINEHVTSIILKIKYYDSVTETWLCEPTISIVEQLGTISEKPQHDC